jgi:hypothetical protein
MSYESKYIKYKNKYLKLKEYLGGTPYNLTEITINNSVKKINSSVYYNKQLTTLTIGKSVKEICDYAFSNNLLTTLTIPISVKIIGNSAFSNNLLTTLTFSSSFKMIFDRLINKELTIGCRAFFNNKLTELIIPNSVKRISNEAFSNNELTKLLIPNSVKYIGYRAFSNNKLTQLIISKSVKNIDDDAFSNNKLTQLIISNSVENIGNKAFSNNELTKLLIPNSVKYIGDDAFSNNKLTQLVISNSVEMIGNKAFSNNELTKLLIPNFVKNIGDEAFSNNKLTQLIISNSVEMIGNKAFSNNKLTELIIPNSVKFIELGAFSENALTKITTYNKEFNNQSNICRITNINKERIIINKVNKDAPYIIQIKEEIYIPYIIYDKKSIVVINIKYTINDNKRINNFIDQLYINTDFKELIDNNENKSLFIILTKIITTSDGHTKEIQEHTIDDQGVTSFMFNNLFVDLTETYKYFISIDNYYILNPQILLGKSIEDGTKLKKKIEFIGKLFAYALQLKQTIDIELHPLLLYKIIFGINVSINENHINYLINNFDLDRKESPFGCFIEPVVEPCKYNIENYSKLTNTEIIKENALELINKKSETYKNDILYSFVTGFITKIKFKNYKDIELVSILSELISGKNKMWSLNEFIKQLEFKGGNYLSRDHFIMIIKQVITYELIKKGELKDGQSITEDMCNKIDNETIKSWISLFIRLLTNKKKIPIDEFKYKKLTICFIDLNETYFRPYTVHVCFHTIDIYNNDIIKLDKALLYDSLKIDNMKDQVGDIGLI